MNDLHEGNYPDVPVDHDAWGHSPGATSRAPGQQTVGVAPRRDYTPDKQALVVLELRLGEGDGGQGGHLLNPGEIHAKHVVRVPFYLCEGEEEGPEFYRRVGLLGQLVRDVIGGEGAFRAELEQHGITSSGTEARPYRDEELEAIREAWDKRLHTDSATGDRFEVAVEGDAVVCRPAVRKLGEDEVFCGLCGKVIAPDEARDEIDGVEYCIRCGVRKVEWKAQAERCHAPGEDPDYCAHCGKSLEDEAVVYECAVGTLCAACHGDEPDLEEDDFEDDLGEDEGPDDA